MYAAPTFLRRSGAKQALKGCGVPGGEIARRTKHAAEKCVGFALGGFVTSVGAVASLKGESWGSFQDGSLESVIRALLSSSADETGCGFGFLQASNASALEQKVNRQDRSVSTVVAAAATPMFRDLTDGSLHKSIEQLRAAAKRADADVEELQGRVGDNQEQMMRVKMSWVNMHGHLQQVEHALWETLQMFSDKKGGGGAGGGSGAGGSGPVGMESGEWHGLQFPTVEPPAGSTTELANPTPRAPINFCNWVRALTPTRTLSRRG